MGITLVQCHKPARRRKPLHGPLYGPIAWISHIRHPHDVPFRHQPTLLVDAKGREFLEVRYEREVWGPSPSGSGISGQSVLWEESIRHALDPPSLVSACCLPRTGPRFDRRCRSL